MDYYKYLKLAYNEALASPDLSTWNGAIIIDSQGRIIGSGCNTLPTGVAVLPERLERPEKYLFTEHAERNAIYNAAYRGNRTKDATMICPWFACAECGRAIIQAGITTIVGHKKMFEETTERWKDSITNAFRMFDEVGMKTILLEGNLDIAPIRFNESMWTP